MERRDTDDFLTRLAAENADAVALAAERPPAPEIYPELDWIWRAWLALRSDRPFGSMGGQFPMPFSAIDAYARRHHITGSEFDLLHRLLTALDAVYLTIANKKEG